ncbi:hypothetical protein B5S28_g421 [[Candida] boidinii]|nr:hypothetical protein B5S28_g421 [[Candida] boidinii]OWB76831.1 hypothetical protein B5S32_g987 [[Candida] boidinii]GMF27603.1 unnamed protein product [[Candida] boidinii]
MFKFVPNIARRFASTVSHQVSIRQPLTNIIMKPVFNTTNTASSFVKVNNINNNSKLLTAVMEDINNMNITKSDPVTSSNSNEMILTSVLRKRRLKMKKHKLRKRRKAQKALKIKFGH